MLKWTLRNSTDAPPSNPLTEARYQVKRAEVKLNLKDSNKCWLETQVKVAQVRSTSRIVGTTKENEVLEPRENGKFSHEKENESVFKRWISPSNAHGDEDKKRKRQHKHIRNNSCRCNPLDPLRLFSGEVTDSDTGSVYMRLEHTPAALQPRPQVIATTGLNDPRRKPLCDISNGDYSDLRKHLQCISSSHLHHPSYHHHSHELPQYLQRFAAPSHAHSHAQAHAHSHHSRQPSGHFQRFVPPPPPRPDPLGASDSQTNIHIDPRRRSRSSSRSRSRSSSAPRSLPVGAVNTTHLLNGSTITTSSHNSTARGMAEGKSQSMLHEAHCSAYIPHPHTLKRHSIADIPSETSLRGVWQMQKERRGRSSSHERKKDKSYETVRSPKSNRDRRKKRDGDKEGEGKKKERTRVEGRRASREKVKEEPIYEKVDSADDTLVSSKTNSGSSLQSKTSLNSFENAIYMSMKDLRSRCTHTDEPGTCPCQKEHLYSSLHMRISPDPNKTPIHMQDHLYENMLYLPMTEVKNAPSKPIDLNRPLPDPPNFDDAVQDNTCDFTSEPKKDIHKPVAIKISNDLIARFGKSPNDRQHPMPQYGLYLASQPSKKPCKVDDCHQGEGHHQSEKPGKVYKSTGQHVHINYSHNKPEPSIPLHNLRPPPPPPPRKSKSNYNSNSKVKVKSKNPSKPKLDPHLPVIYENTRQEEELLHSAKKRKLRHSMSIEFSFDDDERHLNRSSEDASVSGSSPRGHNSSSDNPDSGVSEGINTPLVSPLSAPRSPQTPRSDSLLEEPCTPLTVDDLHGCNKISKENSEINRHSPVHTGWLHDITDPRFLSLLREVSKSDNSISEACIEDIFHHINQQSVQETASSISTSNFDQTCQNSLDQLELLRSSRGDDLSKIISSAVGRNLFLDSTKLSTPGREIKSPIGDTPNSNTSLMRRHSFSSLADISRRLSKIEFSDETSDLWGMDVSDHDVSPSLKGNKSLQYLDLSMDHPAAGSVPLMDSMAEILRDPDETVLELSLPNCQPSPDNQRHFNPETSEQSDRWILVEDGGGRGYWNENRIGEEGEEEEEGIADGVSPTKGSGKRAGDGQAAQPGSFSELPSSHDHHLSISTHPSVVTAASHCSPTSSNPTLPLPVMSVGGQQHLGMGRESASVSFSSSSSCPLSVPPGPSSSEEEKKSSRLDLSQCISGCADSSVLTADNSSRLTSRQQRRQEESCYRLQRMLQDRPLSPHEIEPEESVSADWSMEAVLDEVSTFECYELDPEIGGNVLPDSPESQDAVSLYTLESEFADSVYISPKLCEKIKEVSEEKMLARLRKSFRSKKEKINNNNDNQITGNGVTKPKVGILMFVDNPMYLSPEVKKEAKVISSHNQNKNSVWYVGNPMYNSPEPNKLRSVNYDAKQRAICEKENLRNARLARVVTQSKSNNNINNNNNNIRKPLASLWFQGNPCYESPDVKNPPSKDAKNPPSKIDTNPIPKTFIRNKPEGFREEDHYLTPKPVNHPKDFVPKPIVVPVDKLNDGNILDLQKFIDHEYCTIPGDESDSWVSQSTSRKSESPIARRSLEFGRTDRMPKIKSGKFSSCSASKTPITPSRIWRQTGKNQHSTPRKYHGTLEKNLDNGAALGTRSHRTPRAVKRSKKIKENAQVLQGNSPSPPPLPSRPHPGHHHYINTLSTSHFEETNDFHHRQALEDLDDSTKFQLPPDSIYESITFLQSGSERKLPAEWEAQSRLLDRAPPTGISSSSATGTVSTSSRSSSSAKVSSRRGATRVQRSTSCMSSFSSEAKNGLGPGSLGEGGLKVRSCKKPTSTKKVTKKYRARDVLEGKGQLKLAVYENFGLLTIHIIEAKKLRSRLSSICNPYVKISLVPDSEERTFCRTPLLRASNSPHFDQKFSFDFLPEDLDKRLLVSVWSRDTLRKRSEFLGCMSFSIAHISTKRVHGWFRLLTETLGRRKHFAVSFLNASHDTTRSRMEEVLVLDDRPTTTTTTNLNHRDEHNNDDELTSVQLNANEIVGNSKSKPKGQTPYTITVCVAKSNQGYGFSVAWTKPPRVERVEAGLPADKAGLKTGDYIIFVGEHNVVKYDEDAVLQVIRECGETIVMEVYRRGVSKPPRNNLVNGIANRASTSDSTTSNETHPRKRLSHISFNTEAHEEDRQKILYTIINCEQAFSNVCRFGLERYLIPLKFRTDLITHSQQSSLFNNMDQLVDLSENIVDRLMGNDDDGIGDGVGFVYYQMADELADHYGKYLTGLPEADKVLSHKLHELDFKDFLLTPQIPRKKPDITTFIHKPAEHLRELVGLLTQLYTSSPGHADNTYLDTVLDKLKACYRNITSQQNIMEPAPPVPPMGTALRPPLVSVSDIEKRLVFTKYTQPFRLHNNRRQWVFGGELFKFEGRNLKQYWVMLFTDLLLFCKINRDRVIFVMEDPVPLNGVVHALFNVKKKATEFRLIIDTSVKVSGSSNSYMTLPKSHAPSKKKKKNNTVTLGRENKRTLVIRAPTIELKATWNNLIQRQLYACQQLPSPLQQLHGESAPSLARAVSSDGLHLPYSSDAGKFSCSVGDLRPSGGDCEEISLNVNDVQPRPPQKLVFRQARYAVGRGRDKVEELVLDYEDDQTGAVPPTSLHLPNTSLNEVPPTGNHRQVSNGVHDDLVINIQDEGGRSRNVDYDSYSRRPGKNSKVKQKGRKGGRKYVARSRGGGGGGYEEEVVLKFTDDPPQGVAAPAGSESSQMDSALPNHNQNVDSVPGIVITENDGVDPGAVDPSYYDEDEDEDVIIEDIRTGRQSNLDPKKGKGIGSKVKDKLFPNRHLPKKKQMKRTEKVEKFVDSIMVEDLNSRGGRVTPIFDREEHLTHQDFAQKRQTLLDSQPKTYMEGDTEVITFDIPETSTAYQSKKDGRKPDMMLEGIEEESEYQESIHKPIISPEAYEDYIGESVENDYPELAGGMDLQRQQEEEDLRMISAQREQELYEEEQERLLFEQQQLEMEEQQRLEDERQLQEQQESMYDHPTGPLSGSASMSFMDDHSPTSNGNSDFYCQCISKSARNPSSKPAFGKCSVESKFGELTDTSKDNMRSAIKTNLLNNDAFDNRLRTSCATRDNYVNIDKKTKRNISLSSSTSASGNESRNHSTSTSEHSSMSISTGSVSSNVLSVKKNNRSSLFLPTSTTSLPEISIEPPTPQAPKPKDNFDRENKIKYDLRVPGYRSMYLTVPGFDDFDGDRYLPKYSYDSNDEDEESSSSDDDVVHKPRVFASLAGMADNQRMKRYGSSCDIAQFGVYGERDQDYNDINANVDAFNCTSKVGGTGSGAFVANKLAVFEKVVEEEHQKFIECQEVRKRIFRPPKKSGEYIEKFYNPQIIENIDARATVRSRTLRYYDDVFDSDDNPRSPPLTNRCLSPPARSSGSSMPGFKTPEMSRYSPNPPRNFMLSSSSDRSEPPITPPPIPVHEEADDCLYGYLGDRPPSSSPGPAYDNITTRQCSPEPHSSLDYYGASRSGSSPGPSSAPQIRTPVPQIRPSDSLDVQTNEVMEMLDNSYLDMNDADVPEVRSEPKKNHKKERCPPPPIANPEIDDVFEIEDYDGMDSVMGSSTSVGRSGHKRKAAPPPPPPKASASASDNKLGGFFNRIRKDNDKDMDKARMKKDKDKSKDKEKPAGKRFQLFGGAKKSNEPSTAEGSDENNSPKKEKKDGKGKRRLFGRGKENFLGRSPNISHKSESQVARMSGDSFEDNSFDLDDGEEYM